MGEPVHSYVGSPVGLPDMCIICDRICKNPPNCLLLQNEIEAHKIDEVIIVVGIKKYFKIINHYCFLDILVKFYGL